MIVDLLIFFGVLSVLVLIHELGHFLVARWVGVKVEEFGFGLPPRIWGKRIGETIYSLNYLPIGGFVRLFGEDENPGGDTKRAFINKSKRARIAIVVAGVVMNFLLAVGVFSFLYTKLGIPTVTNVVKVVGVALNSPAETVGIKEGDIIRQFKDGVRVEEIKDSGRFISLVAQAKGREIEVGIERVGELIYFNLNPRENPPLGEGSLGIAISSVESKFYPWYEMPFRATYFGVSEAFEWTRMIGSGLGGLVSGLITAGRVPADISGPVGIYQVVAQVAKTGYLNLLRLVGILSVNLAVLNILPFPALDGGRLLFIMLEAVFGRKVAPKFERVVHAVGLAILITLILLVTVKDLQKLMFGGGGS